MGIYGAIGHADSKLTSEQVVVITPRGPGVDPGETGVPCACGRSGSRCSLSREGKGVFRVLEMGRRGESLVLEGTKPRSGRSPPFLGKKD